MAWQDVTYGVYSWELPRSRCQHPDPVIRARFFAEALLEGAVLPSMKGKTLNRCFLETVSKILKVSRICFTGGGNIQDAL